MYNKCWCPYIYQFLLKLPTSTFEKVIEAIKSLKCFVTINF